MTLNILLHDISIKVTSAGANHMDIIVGVWPLKVSWNLFEVMSVCEIKLMFGFWFRESLFVSSDFFSYLNQLTVSTANQFQPKIT
jgi:hypothetical protein